MAFNIMKIYADGSRARSMTFDTLRETIAYLPNLAVGYESLTRSGDGFIEVRDKDYTARFQIEEVK